VTALAKTMTPQAGRTARLNRQADHRHLSCPSFPPPPESDFNCFLSTRNEIRRGETSLLTTDIGDLFEFSSPANARTVAFHRPEDGNTSATTATGRVLWKCMSYFSGI
jgi:hypothetical protein